MFGSEYMTGFKFCVPIKFCPFLYVVTMVLLHFYRFGHVYHNLQPRVTRTLLHAFLDPTKALPQHYGAIQGLAALGPSVVSFC